jgi:hypothetical protein
MNRHRELLLIGFTIALLCLGVGLLFLFKPEPCVLITVRDQSTGLLLVKTSAVAIRKHSPRIQRVINWLPKSCQLRLINSDLRVVDGVIEVPFSMVKKPEYNISLIAPGYAPVWFNAQLLQTKAGPPPLNRTGTNSFSCRLITFGPGML